MRNHIKSYDGDGRYDEPLVLVMATVKMNANLNMFLGLGLELVSHYRAWEPSWERLQQIIVS